MIKIDELREFRPDVRLNNGQDISLDKVCNSLKEYAEQMGILIYFKKDTVKMGGLFSKPQECAVMFHPEHEKDYFKFCITVNYQGNYTFVSIKDFGHSKQMDKAQSGAVAKSNLKASFRADNERDQGKALGTFLAAGIKSLGQNKSKLEEEKMYYRSISDFFAEALESISLPSETSSLEKKNYEPQQADGSEYMGNKISLNDNVKVSNEYKESVPSESIKCNEKEETDGKNCSDNTMKMVLVFSLFVLFIYLWVNHVSDKKEKYTGDRDINQLEESDDYSIDSGITTINDSENSNSKNWKEQPELDSSNGGINVQDQMFEIEREDIINNGDASLDSALELYSDILNDLNNGNYTRFSSDVIGLGTYSIADINDDAIPELLIPMSSAASDETCPYIVAIVNHDGYIYHVDGVNVYNVPEYNTFYTSDEEIADEFGLFHCWYNGDSYSCEREYYLSIDGSAIKYEPSVGFNKTDYEGSEELHEYVMDNIISYYLPQYSYDDKSGMGLFNYDTMESDMSVSQDEEGCYGTYTGKLKYDIYDGSLGGTAYGYYYIEFANEVELNCYFATDDCLGQYNTNYVKLSIDANLDTYLEQEITVTGEMYDPGTRYGPYVIVESIEFE